VGGGEIGRTGSGLLSTKEPLIDHFSQTVVSGKIVTNTAEGVGWWWGISIKTGRKKKSNS